MMKLSTMQRVSATLNERGESPVADAIAARWGATPGRARFFRASANFLFQLERADGPHMLRFVHASQRTPDAIRAELAFLDHLWAQGLHVNRAIPSAAGQRVESVETGAGTVHAVLFERLAGEQLDLAELTPEMVTRWGRTLGELHVASVGFHAPARPAWSDHLAHIDARLPAAEGAARTVLAHVGERLARLPVRDDTFDLIHFDFELDNVLWDQGRIGAVDFDDCARYWFAADIAFALRDLFDDDASRVDLQHETVQRFVAGYRSARPIDSAQLANLPTFLALHHLLTFVKLQRTLESAPEQPAWLVALREKLHAKLQTYRDIFHRYLSTVP